jgi:hypothetical protein
MSDFGRRISWRRYGVAMLVPVVGLLLFNAAALGDWLRSGICPGGPMDRPALPCGPLDFVWIVLLGGWAAFLIVPLLVLCWAGITIYFVLAARSRRSQQ